MPRLTPQQIEEYNKSLEAHTHIWQYDTARNRLGDIYGVFICECGETKMVLRK